ncbi:hypothetical protein JCM11641_002881, partial [Rhodosporidiobolus odoratus]
IRAASVADDAAEEAEASADGPDDVPSAIVQLIAATLTKHHSFSLASSALSSDKKMRALLERLREEYDVERDDYKGMVDELVLLATRKEDEEEREEALLDAMETWSC